MTLVALLAMTTGAWAQTVTVTWTQADLEANSDVTTFTKDGVTLKCDTRMSSGKSFVGPVTFSTTLGNFTKIEITGSNSAPITADEFTNDDKVSTWTGNAASISTPASIAYATQFVFTIAPTGPKVSYNDAKTEASFTMPAYDATVSYELVRDMQDKTYPVTFSGIPTDGKITVRKEQNGKYHTTEPLNIQLIDPLIEGDNKNILGINGITIKVLVGDDSTGPVEYDQENPITFEAFQADMKPGFYRIKAVATADGAYEGTVYSTDMWLTEAYNLMLSGNPEMLSKVSFTVDGTAATVSEGNVIKNVKTGKSVKLSVSEGYMFSDMFTGYKVSFTPTGNALAWSKVGCYYWGDYGDGNIFNPVQWPGVEMTKNGNSWETTINVNGLTNIIFNDFKENGAQQTTDLPFASGAADDLGSYTIADAVEMTYNTDKTEATFSMPASDLGMNFNVKRNMASNMTVSVGDGSADYRIRLKKQGDAYTLADLDQQAIMNLVKVYDETEKKQLEQYKDFTFGIYALGTDDKPTGDAIGYDKLTPGTYVAIATATEQSPDYAGTAPLSNTFVLYAGYEVTVDAGEYATFYGKEAVVVEGEDAELYTISSVTESEAVLSDKIETAPKETPLLVYNKGTEAKTFLLIPTTTEAADVTVAKEFCGTAEAKEMPASTEYVDYYVCTGKAFMWVKDAGVIDANRCWLQIGEQPAASRTRTRSITGGSDTTGINAVDSGQFTDDNYYDLQGRKVAKPNRGGIYIHNGKKVVVRK